MKALVIGLGVSGAAAARALRTAGAQVRVADIGAGRALDARAATLRGADVDVVTGPEAADLRLLAGCEVIVPSPGVSPANPLLRAAVRTGVQVWSEPELAWRLRAGDTRLVAVTGTNGKTTVTQLLAACLRAPAAGNIGLPLSQVLTAIPPPPLLVAELSSFQLVFTATLRAHVGVLLNIADDHLDWHGSRAAYAQAKARVWAGQAPGDWAVSNADDPGARAAVAASPPSAGRVAFTLGAPQQGQVGVSAGTVTARLPHASGPVVPTAALRLRGPHNLANVCAAAAAALCAGADVTSLHRPLAAFEAGPHRLEEVARIDGVTWVNDSKATNPHAAAAAVRGYDSVVWIAGGLNKGLRFDELAPALRERVRAAVTIGGSGPQIAALTRALGIPTFEPGTLGAAVATAARLAAAGDTVLLAPACASMDQFRDYAARGEAFRDAVAQLPRVARKAASGH